MRAIFGSASAFSSIDHNANKNAFQWDAYRPLVNCMLQSANGGGIVCSWGGVPGGLPGLGGVCSGGVPGPGCVPGLEGCLVWGSLLPGGMGIPACTEADIPPPCGQTDACENITLAQLRCGR